MVWEDTWRGTDNCDWTPWVSGAQDSSWGSQASLGQLIDQVKMSFLGRLAGSRVWGAWGEDKGSDGKTKAAFPRGQ